MQYGIVANAPSLRRNVAALKSVGRQGLHAAEKNNLVSATPSERLQALMRTM
jgi:hypothetical protein